MNKKEERPAQKWHVNKNSSEAKEESKYLVLPQKDLPLPQKQAVDMTLRQSLRPTVSRFCLQVNKCKPMIPPTYLSTYVHTSGVLHECEKKTFASPSMCWVLGFLCTCFFVNWKMGILTCIWGEVWQRQRNLLCAALTKTMKSWDRRIRGSMTVTQMVKLFWLPLFWFEVIFSHWIFVRVILIAFLGAKFLFNRNSFLQYQHLF